VITLLEQRLNEARNGRIDLVIGLIEPMDQTRDYDRVISMLEMSTEEEIELNHSDFAAYVLDDWAWKRQWVGTNAAYTQIPDYN
jgi:hypothetical protein